MNDKPVADVVFTRKFPASAADVYEAWTSPGVMREWLAPGPNVVIDITSDLRVGGIFVIRSQAPDGAIHTIRGSYLALDPAQRIAMTWTYTGPVALICAIETLIEIDLEAIGVGSTTMTFTQSRTRSQQVADAFEGDWPSCFDKLQTVVEPSQKRKK